MNPFNLTGGPFLAFYVLMLIGAMLFASRVRRQTLDGGGQHPRLTAPELAYLAGGQERLGDAVLIGMLTAKAATLTPDGSVEIDREKADALPDYAPFRLSGKIRRADFHRRIGAQAAAIHGRLEQFGLYFNASQVAAHRRTIIAIFAIPMVIGVIKVFVGLARDKPVGFLILALIVTLVIAVSFLKMPYLTDAGREALAVHRMENARAARAPANDGELMMAVALGGLIVLSGTPFNSLYEASRTANSGGDASSGGGFGVSGGDSGGGDGGGCGGCGGCGGGG